MEILEKDLINCVRSQLASKYNVFEEVGFLNRSIDMVLLGDSLLITVEFKIRDWRKAISQIESHLIAADYSYLCMPKKTISNELLFLLKKNGIGLWLYDYASDELIEAVKPRKSSFQWRHHRDSLLERLVS